MNFKIREIWSFIISNIRDLLIFEQWRQKYTFESKSKFMAVLHSTYTNEPKTIETNPNSLKSIIQFRLVQTMYLVLNDLVDDDEWLPLFDRDVLRIREKTHTKDFRWKLSASKYARRSRFQKDLNQLNESDIYTQKNRNDNNDDVALPRDTFQPRIGGKWSRM